MSESLPNGWVRATLDDVVDVRDFEREPINSSERESRINGKNESDLYPYYGATGQVGFIDAFRSEGQRVLLGEDAAPFLDPTKDKAYLVNGRFWVNNHAHVLAGAAGLIDNKFICHQLNTVDYHPFVTGSTRLKLTSSAMKQIPMVVAPAAEQARIVAKLEELLSDLDAGMAELKAAQKKLGQYRQSLLKAAVEGALTAEWRAKNAPSETGAQLLERILSERRARWEAKQLAKFAKQGKTPPKDWQKKYPQPVQPDTTDLPQLPEGWVWASVDQLGETTTGFTPSTANADYFGGNIPFFKPTDLDAGYEVVNYRESLTALGAAQGRLLPAKSILVTCIGATIGKTGLARVSCATNQQINAISTIEDEVSPEYVFFVMTSGFGQSQIKNNASATTLPILNKSKFERLAIPLPSRSEQDEVIGLLEVKISQIAEEELAVELSLKQSTAQRQNILRAAFVGELVPQDPNDEPARALLERIRAERAERAKQPKTRKTKPKEIATVVSKLIDVLAEAGDWVPAQEAFRRCGVSDGALTERIEELYAELRNLDKAGRLVVEAVTDAQGRKLYDKLKLLAG